jgi:hypothetical protein
MRFAIFGPYPIPRNDRAQISNRQTEFWDSVEKGLKDAKGCYVFCIKGSGAANLKPWYVGKTTNSFAKECFQPHKLGAFNHALAGYERGAPYLIFLAQMTPSKRFFQGSSSNSIDFLENHLIAEALRANDELVNKRQTKFLREMIVPGLINSPPGAAQTKSVAQLRACLGM